MKNLILMLFLSFVALSCSKDTNEPKKEITQTRIKNDLPDELLGKWKEVADKHDEDGIWVTTDTGKKYDLYFKEYSNCCEDASIVIQDCDYYSYSAKQQNNGRYSLFSKFCSSGEPSSSFSNSFYILESKGTTELFLYRGGYDTGTEYKYIKIE